MWNKTDPMIEKEKWNKRSNLPFKVLGDFVENSETIVWDAKSVQRDIFLILSLQNCFLFRRH